MTSMRCAAIALAVRAICGVVLVGSVVTACSSSGSPAPTLAQVGPLLMRHTQAVVRHSAAEFLVDVSTAPESAGFRNRQRADIAALAGVPFTAWSYTIDAPVNDPSATAVASARYHASAIIVRVGLTYQLAQVDPVPSTRWLWWTFVRHSGRVVLAGDDDMAGVGGVSWRGPWDFGPVAVHRGRASLVLGHPDHNAVLAAISADTDAAVAAVTSMVGTGWARQVAVFVPSSSAEFDALSGGTSSTDVSAVAVLGTANSPSGARVLVRPDALSQLTPAGLRIVLRHEVTHVAMADRTTPITPRWLIEGFAEYVGNLDSGQPVRTAAAELATAVRAGSLPAALPMDSDFGGTAVATARVYEESWLACRYLAHRLGPSGLLAFYTAVGQTNVPNDAAVGVVVQSQLHESLAAFAAQWRAYLRSQLG